MGKRVELGRDFNVIALADTITVPLTRAAAVSFVTFEDDGSTIATITELDSTAANAEQALAIGRIHHQHRPDKVRIEKFALEPATIDALSATNLSMHMVQHLLLLMIVPLFFLLANPLPGFLWGLPVKWRKPFCRLLNPASPFRRLLWVLTLLPVAWSVYVFNLWAWHHPSLYQFEHSQKSN